MNVSVEVRDILLLTPGFACADSVWSSACVWPQTTQPSPVDIKHMKPEELNEYETILNTVKLIHVACFNEEVFEIIHNIKTDDARDLVVAFYVYIEHDFHYVGSFGANRKIFKTEIINHNHYFVRNFYHLYIGNGRSWIIDKLIMIPHVKADIIQFCDDIHCTCEIDDFDDDSIKPLTKVGELDKTAAIGEYLVAKDEGNKISDAFYTDAIINVNDDSTTNKLNRICTDKKLFQLPCICNNGNRYSNPYIDRFLKPCVYSNPEKYQNICPCTKLSNLLGLKPCKFMSNLSPFLCKNLPSINIDKPSFNPITKQIYPLNFVQKLYPSSQYSKWCIPNQYYATYNTKPNINDNLFLKEYSPNTETSNGFYENGKVNIDQINDNDDDSNFLPNITPNGQTTAICNVQSNAKKSQFTVFSSQTLPTNNNENNKVVITGQPQFVSNQNPFNTVMQNGVNQFPPELNALCENEEKLTKIQGFSVDKNQAPLPEMLEKGKLVVGKIPEHPDSSVTNVCPNNKSTYYLQNADLTTINENQKFPEDKTKSPSHIFITNNNYPNVGIVTTDVDKQTIKPLQSRYDEVISENIGNRFICEKSEPLATTLYPKFVPTIKNDKIEYSDAIPSNTPKSHGDLIIDRELSQIGSNINIFPESIVPSGLPNVQSTDTLSGRFHVMPGYKTYNDSKTQLVSLENVYAVNNNKIQSTQPNMSNEVFPYSLLNEQIATNPPISYQLKSNVPIENIDIGVLQLNNKYMNPKTTTKFAKLPEYKILNGRIDDNERSSVQDIDTLIGSILEVPYYRANNGDRIHFENPQNDNNKIQGIQKNLPYEVISNSLPEEQIAVEPLICYDSKFNQNTPNTNIKVLELNNKYMNPKTLITFTKLPEYEVSNKEITTQGIDVLTGNILVPPDNTIQLNNFQNTYAAPYNKIQSPQHNIPNEVFSYSLPDEQIVVNPFSSKSNLNLPTVNTNMRILNLNNEHMNPKASKTFTKSAEYEIPCSVSDKNKKPDGTNVNTLTDDVFVTPDYKADNDDRRELNNLQNAYLLNINETPSMQNNIPSEILSYSLPTKRIPINSLTDTKPKFDLPTPNILQFNKNINSKDATEYEIPCSETDKNKKTDGLSVDTLTGGLYAVPDYNTNNDDKIQLNNPQNIYRERYNKIPSAQNIVPDEILSYSLPEKQIASILPINYQQKLNQLTPNILQLPNPKATIAFTPEYKMPCGETNEKKADQLNVDTLKGDFFATTNYKTDNDRKLLTNPQNAYVLNRNRISSIQNNIPSEFLSYSLPIQQIAANSLINSKPKFDLRTPNILQLYNKDMIPKATIALNKLPDFEIPCNKIDENKKADGQSINTVTGSLFIEPEYKTNNNDRIQLKNPQNIYGENYQKIPSDQTILPYEILPYSLPEKQIAVNLPISYEPKLNQLTPNILQIKNAEHMKPNAPISFAELPEYEIPCSETAQNNKADGPSIDTLTGDLLGTPDYKADNNQKIQFNYPQSAYAVNNNGIPSTRNNIPSEVMSSSLPGETIAVNPPTNYQSRLNLPAPNILQLNNKDMNPKATITLTKLPDYEISCSEINGNKKADGQSINTVTGSLFIAPDYKTNNNDGIQLKNPQNVHGENYKKITSDQNIVPYEILPYPLPEKQIAANLPISYEPKLNQLNPHILQIKNEHMNPKAPIVFTELPEYEIPCSETTENKKADGSSTDTLTGDILGIPDYKADNNQMIQFNYPQSAYAVNKNRIPSTRNNMLNEVMSNFLPGEAFAVNPPTNYQSRLNLPAPNILQLNNKDMNPKALNKLPHYDIPCSEISGNKKADEQSINTVTGSLFIAPDYKTNNNDGIQLKNTQNIHGENYKKIPSDQNIVPYEILPYPLPEKQIAANLPISYEPKLNQLNPYILQIKNEHMNPKTPIAFTELPEYEIPCSETTENKKADGPSTDTLTGDILGIPDYSADNNQMIQLNYPQSAYAVNKNRIPSTRNNMLNEVMSNFLPGEAFAVNPLTNYQSRLNPPTPNILQLNNKDMYSKSLTKLPDYEIPCSLIDGSKKVNKQGMNTLRGDLPVAPDDKLDNYDIIQLNNPQITQNLNALSNNKLPGTQNNIPCEALSYSLPEKLIEIVENINPLTNYESKLNLPTPTTNVKMLHLNNDPKASFEIPNNQIDEKDNPNIQSIDSLTDIGLAMPYYKTDDSDRIQVNSLQNVYGLSKNTTQSPQNIPDEVLSYSSPNNQISVKPSIIYESKLNLPTSNILQLNSKYTNPNTERTFENIPQYQTLNNRINENLTVQDIDALTNGVLVMPDTNIGDTIQLDSIQNVYSVNNIKIQDRPNNILNILPHSLSNEQIVNPPIIYQKTPTADLSLLHLNKEYMKPKATVAFAHQPEYEIANNSDKIQLKNPRNVYAPEKIITYSLPNAQIPLKPPISYKSQLNVPTLNTDIGLLQLNNDYINPKVTTIDKEENPNVKSVDTVTSDLFVTSDLNTKNNVRIQHENYQNVYARNNNKLQSAPNDVPYEVLPCSWPYGQIAVNAPLSYQSHLYEPTLNIGTEILQLNNDYPKKTITLGKLPQYELLNNQISKKGEPNKQRSDLTGSFVSINSVFSPLNVKTGTYGPMQMYSAPLAVVNPSAINIISTENNNHTPVNIKPEKDYMSNYSNSNYYTLMNSGQINDEIFSPKETADKIKMHQINYIPQELTQYEVPQQIIFKNNERNVVPKEKYVEFDSTLPKYTNFNTYIQPHEVIPKFALNGKNNHDVVSPLFYDGIPIKNAGCIPLYINADVDVTNMVIENKYPSYLHQKEDFNENSKHIDKADEEYTINVSVISKNENNNGPDYGLPIQAALYNPQINIDNIKLETTENGNQLRYPSENFSFMDQSSVESLSPFNSDESKKGNFYNIENNEYVNLPRKLSNPNDSETDSEVINVYDIELKSNNKASILPFEGSDQQQYEMVNNVNQNPNIEALDVNPAYITNLNDSNKGTEEPNLEVKEPLNKPAFTSVEVTDTKNNMRPEKYEIKYTELVKENNAKEKPINVVVENKPTIVANMAEKIANNDFSYIKPPSTLFETSSTDTLYTNIYPDKILEPTMKYIKENQNFSFIGQAQNAITGIDIQKDTSIPLLDKEQQFTDMATEQTLDNNIMFTPEISIKSSPEEGNIVNDTCKIMTEDDNICSEDLIYNTKYQKETPIEEKYESYGVSDTNYDDIPVIEINNEFKRTDGNNEIPKIELHEILSEMTTLPVKQSADSHFKYLDQPIEIIENNYLNDYQHLNKNYKLYEKKTCESLPFEISSSTNEYIKPTSLIFNYQPSQTKTMTKPTREEFSALNEIKYDESSSPSYTSIPSLIASSSNSIPFYKDSISASTIPCTDISASENYLKPFTKATSLPQSWLTYDSGKPTEQPLVTSVSPIYNTNPCLSQNLNQPTIDFSQAQSTIVNALKSNLLNYIKANVNAFDNTVNIPLGDLGVAKYDPIENTQYFTINTENDDINLKAWYSKVKLIKVKITFETVEASALNFIPIVYNKSKYCPVKVQEVAKNAISKVYGEPIVIKGMYTFDIPYVIVDNVDSACTYNGGYILLWPTYCGCGCEKAGCQCYLQNCNDSSQK